MYPSIVNRSSESDTWVSRCRHCIYASFLIVALSTAGCGGSDNPVVANDNANDPARVDGTAGTGVTNGSGISNTGNGSNGNAGDLDGGVVGSGPIQGDPLLADLTVAPTSVTYDCKVESSLGTAVQESRLLEFDRSTLTFSVSGSPVVRDGFVWSASDMEWVTSTLEENNGVVQEYFAKLDPQSIPTYFRSKLTQLDFSFEQIECYRGLAVQGPFIDGIPDALSAQSVACRTIQTAIADGSTLSDSGIVQEEYLVRDGTFLASLISDALDTASIVVRQPLPPTSSRTVLVNGDVMYETSITSSFVRTSQLVIDAIGRFKYARSQVGSRTGNGETFCGLGVESFR